MIISFKKVIAHNFLSLGDVELKLDNQGYTLISGINNNPTDNASSNGSGKSAMFQLYRTHSQVKLSMDLPVTL